MIPNKCPKVKKLPVMVHHSSVGFFRKICTAGLPKYHLQNKREIFLEGYDAVRMDCNYKAVLIQSTCSSIHC